MRDCFEASYTPASGSIVVTPFFLTCISQIKDKDKEKTKELNAILSHRPIFFFSSSAPPASFINVSVSAWKRWYLNLFILKGNKLVMEFTGMLLSTKKHRVLEAGKMDEQNSSGGAGIFRTSRQSINRDGEEMNSVTNN